MPSRNSRKGREDSERQNKGTMHIKRWLTAIIAIPVLLYVIGIGHPWLFILLLCLVSLAGLIEFYAMAAPDLSGFIRWPIYLSVFLLLLVIYRRQILFLPVIVLLWAFVPMILLTFSRPPGNRRNTADISRVALGPIYVALPLAMLLDIFLHYPGRGKIWIFFLLAVIIASDTGAFYFGRLFGRHRLYAAISPGKTWEGAAGGLISSIIVAIWFLHLFPLHPVDLKILAIVVTLSVTGQIGDLMESMLKRDHGVKDSGKILPGHGGILDRIDGLLFAIPVLYVFLTYSI